ncbi:hypothetical protein CXB51_001715 [Gossypium anomalum]|uniref:Integrase catalytic domain-containing protein n=1 Tax=Gossypium anomalum TaxID=47600 RepID=A0A8J5ZKH9_9ROSI|nr:hypothetical protein CXB51_001715 [Gossypium anomalum]
MTAMIEEMWALAKNETWELVNSPEGQKMCSEAQKGWKSFGASSHYPPALFEEVYMKVPPGFKDKDTQGKSTLGKGILFSKNSRIKIKVFTNAGWAGSFDDKRSTIGSCTLVGGNLVTWRSTKQSIMALSSVEAEYRAMAQGVCYDLEGFVLGTTPVPSTHLPGPDGQAKSNIKLSSMCHALYSLKKGSLTVKEYLTKVKSFSDSLNAAGSMVTETAPLRTTLLLLTVVITSVNMVTEGKAMVGLVAGLVALVEAAVTSPRQQSSTAHDQAWYLDSGATNHITSDMTILSAVSPYTGMRHISMGNGASVSISNIGSSGMQAGSQIFCLKNILHVLTVCKNLLSVAQFAKDNAVYFEFHPLLCFVKDIQTGKALLVGRMHNGLYKFDIFKPVLSKHGVIPQSNSTCFYTNQLMPSPALWHNRLGHPCTNVLIDVLKNCNVPFKRNTLSTVCSACQLGKAHKLLFSSSKTLYSSPFELVEYDVWGSAHLKSNGFVCYVSFVDMYSSDFQPTGGEYRLLSKELSRLGIQHRITCPHTSDQNGVVERKHRHLFDMGLTLLAQASLPLDFWSQAFSHAVFGCACFSCLRPYQNHKLEFRSRQCIFLSIAPNRKGYQCLDPDGRMFVSRHVTFDETSFPFQAGSFLYSGSASFGSSRHKSSLPLVVAIDTLPNNSSGFDQVIMSPMASSIQPSGLYSPTHHSGSSNSPIVPSTSHSHTEPSLTAPQSSSPAQVIHTENVHPMRTCSKNGIFRPKVFAFILTEQKPTSIVEAFKSPAWITAAHNEYEALLANHTWDLVPLPEGRLIVKGYLQEAGVDFQETFSPVVKPTTIRVVLALVVSMGWPLLQVDINNAFLNGDLQEEIYMGQPPGFEQQGSVDQQLVYRLRKALYGLKQAPRASFHKLREFLVTANFVASKADNSLFVYRSGSQLLYVLVYVDDIIITGTDSQAIDRFVKELDVQFSLKDLGSLGYFLGIKLNYTPHGIFLSQRKYILDLLTWGSMDNSNVSPTSMTMTCHLTATEGIPVEDAKLYRSIGGALQYVIITRPDIALSINKFTRSPKFLLKGFSDVVGDLTVMIVGQCPCDSSVAVGVAGNPVMHSKFKHVELDLFFVAVSQVQGSAQDNYS